jgi:hypothetical protein
MKHHSNTAIRPQNRIFRAYFHNGEKMKLTIPLLLATFLLGSCSFLGNDLSCSSGDAKELVEKIEVPNAKTYLAVEIFMSETDKYKNVGKPAMKRLKPSDLDIKNMENLLLSAFAPIDFMMMKDEAKKAEYLARAEKLFEGYSFNLDNIRTIQKDKDVQRVQCQASVNIKHKDAAGKPTTYVKDITYNAQLTDDGQKIFVEILREESE